MKTCNECLAHFVELGKGQNGKGEAVQVGLCYRYPPAVTVSGSTAYPVVGAIERACGEFSSVHRKATK